MRVGRTSVVQRAVCDAHLFVPREAEHGGENRSSHVGCVDVPSTARCHHALRLATRSLLGPRRPTGLADDALLVPRPRLRRCDLLLRRRRARLAAAGSSGARPLGGVEGSRRTALARRALDCRRSWLCWRLRASHVCACLRPPSEKVSEMRGERGEERSGERGGSRLG